MFLATPETCIDIHIAYIADYVTKKLAEQPFRCHSVTITFSQPVCHSQCVTASVSQPLSASHSHSVTVMITVKGGVTAYCHNNCHGSAAVSVIPTEDQSQFHNFTGSVTPREHGLPLTLLTTCFSFGFSNLAETVCLANCFLIFSPSLVFSDVNS